jgi:hypothetical protein
MAGRYPEAIAAYKKALELSPNNFNAAFAKKSIQKMEAELRNGLNDHDNNFPIASLVSAIARTTGA